MLRIEDTDRVRSKKEFEDEILTSMRWLGLDWDELYHQSDRFEIYKEYAQRLVKEDKAYNDGDAVILKIVQGEIKIYDLIRDEITFDSSTIKDQVLMKSDGSPTYSFACVVDDSLMEISHVIRGEDHISNTPKQILIYEALGLKPPKYAHLPLIMGEEGRLSKRTGAVAVSDYKKEGYLAEALVNYLMLLGWSPGANQEVVDLRAALKNFSIKKINKAAAVFSMEKLKWVNSQYIKKFDDEKLTDMLIPFLEAEGHISGDFDRNHLKSIVKLFKGRMGTLKDFLEWTDFVFADQLNYDPKAKSEHLSADRSKEFSLLAERFGRLNPFRAKEIEEAFRQTVDELGLKASDLVHPVRVALTGRAVGPGLFETVEILGKEKTLERLKGAFN